jgi:uncharacterized protein YndB with AHSA1/START domain/DNA-binding transcriptional ArsR family regulator
MSVTGDTTEATIRALADPGRRSILDALRAEDSLTVTALGEAVPALGRHAVLKHIGVLERAGLVSTRKVGRRRLVSLDPVPLVRLAERWLDEYSARSATALIHLASHVEKETLMNETEHVVTQTRTVRAAIMIEASPEQVWQALTDPSQTRRWYFGTEIRSTFEPGAALDYVDSDGVVQIRGVVIEAIPSRSLVHTFNATWSPEVTGDPESVYAWHLEAVGALTKVSIVHSDVPVASHTEDEVEEGATMLLSALKTLLETGRPLRRTSD